MCSAHPPPIDKKKNNFGKAHAIITGNSCIVRFPLHTVRKTRKSLPPAQTLLHEQQQLVDDGATEVIPEAQLEQMLAVALNLSSSTSSLAGSSLSEPRSEELHVDVAAILHTLALVAPPPSPPIPASQVERQWLEDEAQRAIDLDHNEALIADLYSYNGSVDL